MVKYLGSKRRLVPLIARMAAQLPIRSVADPFAGTTRVGQALRALGLVVHSSDLATYSEAFGQAYIAADRTVDRDRLRALIAHLDALPPRRGYFTETFCERARYLRPENGMRVDAIRDGIEALRPDPVERGLLLTSLLEAADRVDSTCGLQMAYVKSWAPRSTRPLALREPAPVAGPAGFVTRGDANALASSLDGVDCAYLDPPYNQHSYFSNYHVWETLVRWDAPEHYGVACKRLDCRTTRSDYNARRTAPGALAELIERLPTPWLIASMSDEGFHDPREIAELLAGRGHVGAVAVDSRRYVGAQIGVFNPSGVRTGRISHLRNTELLMVAGPDEERVRAAVTAATGAGAGRAPAPALR